MGESSKTLSFWDHLEELRYMLWRCIGACLVLTIAAFVFVPKIFDSFIAGPCSSDFFLYDYLCRLSNHLPFIPDFCSSGFKIEIININLASQFFTHISLSFVMAIVATFPYIVFELWRFISPALYRHEKKKFKFAFVSGALFFYCGCAVGYALVFPITLRFLAGYQLSASIANQLSLDSYMSNFFMMIFIMGIVFELPIIAMLLSKLGLLTRNIFSKYRRHAIVALLILAAFITPSGDPFTLLVVFSPLYLLWELSALFVKKKKEEQEEDELEETPA